MATRKPARKSIRQSRKSHPVPRGLINAFKLTVFDDAEAAAREAYPHAVRIVKLLHEADDAAGRLIWQELITSAETAHTRASRPAHEPNAGEDPGLVSVSSYHVGIAVAWLQLTSVNGMVAPAPLMGGTWGR